jgi:competence protein ComEC
VAVGLLPLLLLLFGRASLIAPLVNLVAVPLFSLLVLPLVLVASLLSLVPGLSMPLVLTAHLLDWGLDGLAWLSRLPWASASMSARPSWVFAVAAGGALLLLAPRGLPGRWLGLVLLLPLLVVRPLGPGYGELWLTLLDVGQGLSAVVQTRDGTLVFDTGPGYESGFNTGSAVVAPFLVHRGVGRVDLLVLSHADRDHAGGARGLASGIEVARVISGEPDAVDAEAAEPCRAGEDWDWSGVSFSLLHPDGSGYSGNDASCVLQIRAGNQAILLTGDIGIGVEQKLVERIGEGLRSQVLVAAHHGSATSTGAALLDAVDPDLVLFSSGYANHFGFPTPEVMERVTNRVAATRDTGTEGAIELRIGADGVIDGPWSWRWKAARLWNHRPRP